MRKPRAIELIENYKNNLTDTRAILEWAWLQVIIDHIPAEQWEEATLRAVKTISR